MKYHSKEEKTAATAIIATVAPLAVPGVLVVLAVVTLPQQQAEAQRGCPLDTPAPNTSKA
jgi:hypothetical protein